MLENIFGFILNIPMDYKWGILHLPLRRKHWIVIRRIGRNYYNLDSKLDSPEVIGNSGTLIKYLHEQMECKDKELLLVVSQRVSTNGIWWRDPASTHPQDKSGKITVPSKEQTPGIKNRAEPNAPLAESEDDKSHELEWTIDCRIVSGAVEKPKYLKKYHQDYVPIEIHRTIAKKEVHSLDGNSEVDNTKGMAPVDGDSIEDNELRKNDHDKCPEINGDLNRSESAIPETTLTVVKQAEDAL